MAAMAHAAMMLKMNRLSLADIVVRPHVGNRLLETFGTSRGRRRDPRAGRERRELGEIVARNGNLEAHVLAVVLRRYKLDRQRQKVLGRCRAARDASHAGSRIDAGPSQRDAIAVVERVEL